MGRPRSVEGGRPHVLQVRLSDAELAQLEAMRGGLTASDYIRQTVLRPDLVTTVEVTGSGEASDPYRYQPERVMPIPDTVLDDHVHLWKKFSPLLDGCDCGADRPHRAGTK